MKTKNLVAVLALGVTLALLLHVTPAHAARCSDGREASANANADASHANDSSEAKDTKDDESSKTKPECIEADVFFMPGAFGVFFQPHRAGGPFYGGGLQIAPFQWSHNNDKFGPSQGSLYFQVALLQSQQVHGAMALFEGGATASLERNASRRWLIPYFGATLGGMTQAQLGTSAHVYPLAGAHLYWHRNLMVDAEGGYHFPFEDIDRTRGARAQLTARFSMW